ncbi:MAG: AMP-binding protein, partial [Methylocystis sp.]
MLLLARLSGRSDVTLGVTRSGRSGDRMGIERAVGLYINTLPIRREVGLGADLSEWLRDLQQEQARQEEYGHLSLSEIQRCAGSMGGASLFETLFVYENYPVETTAGNIAPAIEIADIKINDGTYNTISLMVLPGVSVKLRFIYNRMKLDFKTVADLSDRLVWILEAIALSVAVTRVGEIVKLSPQEREQLLVAFNDTQKDIPHTTLPDLFAAQVERTPEAIALIFGDEEVSYQELDRRANQLARYLIEQNIGPEDIVAIGLDRSIEMVVSLLGVLKSGAAYLPLDPEYPPERLAFMLADSKARCLITTGKIYDRFSGEILSEQIASSYQDADSNHISHTASLTSGALGSASPVLRGEDPSDSLNIASAPFRLPTALLLDDQVLQAELATLSSAPITN